MTKPVQTKTFKSGNSVAVRLPKGFAIGPDIGVEIQKSGDTVTIRLARDPALAQQRMRQALADMAALGPPSDGVQQRAGIEFPDRDKLL
jgi:antitoxin VapB